MRPKNKPKILVIVGPTATGKSNLAVRLAKKLNGEVISADSRQVYKGLTIGTGKITKKEMKGVAHHLLDVADPHTQYSVIKYEADATKAIADCVQRNKLPIITGGTGFYIQALVEGIILPDVPPNKKLRAKLNKMSADRLLKLLKKLDPQRYKTIEKKNLRRVIRAIEIATALGKVPKLKKSAAKYEPLFIGLNLSPVELRKRIHARLLKRIKAGMIAEAKRLHAPKLAGMDRTRSRGLTYARMNELGLEYRYLALYLQRKLTKKEMVEKLSTEIWQYAKRQMTWFKKDRRIEWHDPTDSSDVSHIRAHVQTFLNK